MPIPFCKIVGAGLNIFLRLEQDGRRLVKADVIPDIEQIGIRDDLHKPDRAGTGNRRPAKSALRLDDRVDDIGFDAV